jgi:sugar lactone lactonase YvrE
MKGRGKWLAAAVFALPAGMWASATAAWEMNTYADFVKGRFQGVSLTRDGRLTLAPRLDTVFSSDQAVVWAVVRAPDGTIYAATGHRGRVFRIDASGKSTLLWTAPQPEVFALALDRSGALYAASSPDGRVYRIEKGAAAEYFDPHSRYIWSLAISPDGSLYVGTGDQGKVFRVTAPGKGEAWYETGQSHVTSLAVDGQGRLLAGTEPNGVLYRITGKDKAFALYDASLPEIHAIVPAEDGTIYASALGGSLSMRVQSASQAAQGTSVTSTVTAAPTSITVEANAQSGADIKPPQPDARQVQQQAAAAATPQVTTQFTPTMDMSGVEKSAVYRINPDNTVETVWSSKEENAYDILRMGDRLLISTDGNGRVYALSPDRKATLMVQTNESEATRLLSAGGAVLAATGNMGRIYRLGDAEAATGSYESPVYDTGSTARWGSLSWRGRALEGAVLKFETRAGNSARPDRSWSDWSAGMTDPAASRIASPNARYIQWRVEFAAAGKSAPALDSVTVAYLPQNTAPAVKSINVTQSASASAAKPAAAQASSAPYTVTVSDTGDASGSSAAGTPTTILSRSVTPQITLTWQAEDPDGDRLVYTTYFRGEDEQEWKLLKANLHENTFTFDGDAMADGKYYFRIVASDREANPPSSARTAELTSGPVLIDNTPPAISMGRVQRGPAGAVTIEFEAADTASPLRRCEYSLDAAGWVPVEAVDGVIDSPRERFVLQLTGVPAGEHLVVIRVVDSASNAGLAKVVLR